MSNNTGGPAFPELGNVGYNSEWQNESGMTLRDYFAAKALSGILSNQQCTPFGMSFGADERESLSRNAYRIADAMLKAREGL